MINPEVRTAPQEVQIERTSALKYTITHEAIRGLYLPKGKGAIFARVTTDFFPQYQSAIVKAQVISAEDWEEKLKRAKQNPLLDIAYRTLVKKLAEKGIINPTLNQTKQLTLKRQEITRKAAIQELCNLHLEVNPDKPFSLSKAATLLGCTKQRIYYIYHELEKDQEYPLPHLATH
jgi:hypothetical protein